MWWVTGHLGSSWDIGSFKNKKEMNHPNSLLLPSPVHGGAARLLWEGSRNRRGREARMKWGFMVSSDKCDGLAETAGFYEQCFRADWLLK